MSDKQRNVMFPKRSKIFKTTGPTYTCFQIDPFFLLFQQFNCNNKFKKFINIL